AARFFLQQRRLDAVRELAPGDARLDVRGRRVEGLAERQRFGVVVAIGAEGLFQAGRRRDLGAVGVLGGHVDAKDAVRGLQVSLAGALHVVERYLAQTLAVQEEQA